MRLYTVTVVCRLGDDDEPKFSIDVDMEEGVPRAVLDTIPKALQSVGRSMEKKLDDGEAVITER